MMLARKWDRLEGMLAVVGDAEARWDIFQRIQVNPSGDDGTVLAEIRDLRRYLLLVEAEMVARGAVRVGGVRWTPPAGTVEVRSILNTPPGSLHPEEAVEIRRVPGTAVPVHAVGDPEPLGTGNPEVHDYEGAVLGRQPLPLPPSLAVIPNIPHSEQTLEQLRAERDYWDRKVREAPGWGASLSAAAGFRESCNVWIRRREKEASEKTPRPVPVEDSNRHADRVRPSRLRAGVNSFEFSLLPKEDRNLYSWDDERHEYRLRDE